MAPFLLLALAAGPPLPDPVWAADRNVFPVLEHLARQRRAAHRPAMSWLDNGTVRLGVDLNLGGAITHLSASRGDNLVNSWDWGRQIQMSFYSGPPLVTAGPRRPFPAWATLGWNPVQAGDHFGHRSRLTAFRNDGSTLLVRCRPMLWPLAGVPAECEMESIITLDRDAALVRCRLFLARSDRTRYPPREQEMPALYTNGPYHRLLSYTGLRPFTGDKLSTVVKEPGGSFPWARFTATEHWAALVNDAGFGVGVHQPATAGFLGGFAGKRGRGAAADFPTGYLAPVRAAALAPDGVHGYHYTLVVGTVDAIRARAKRPTR
ncbi:MAG: hypothetical protein ACRC33_00360 [Gemmataceae bacterium]